MTPQQAPKPTLFIFGDSKTPQQNQEQNPGAFKKCKCRFLKPPK